jgi:hypothetical protein
MFGKDRQANKADVMANVAFVPPNAKQYTIRQAKGAGIGERIVREMLDHETDVAKNLNSTELSPDNYDFRLVREEDAGGYRCYVVQLLPRRTETNLLRGNVWLDTTTYLPRRTEGVPAKNPSWWLRDVRIELEYGDVGGMWLQTSSESSANVRLFGLVTMVSRDVEYDMSQLAAGVGAPGAVTP